MSLRRKAWMMGVATFSQWSTEWKLLSTRSASARTCCGRTALLLPYKPE